MPAGVRTQSLLSPRGVEATPGTLNSEHLFVEEHTLGIGAGKGVFRENATGTMRTL